MRFGLDVPVSGEYADPRLLADLAREAEAAGWDGFFLQDVFSSSEPVAEPWISLAAVALRTERVRLGIFLTPLARRRPWQVARQSVTIDQLSGGRLIFGAGLGYSDIDFSPFGEEWDAKIRAAKLDEALQVLAGLWTGESFSFSGRHHQLTGAVLRPGPLQAPRIPVWVAAGWPRRRPLERAASWDGVYLMTVHQKTGELLTPADIAEVSSYLASRRAGSAAPPEIALNAEPAGDPDVDTERVRRFADAGATWWVELAPDDGGPESYRKHIRRGPPQPRAS